jgi:hypothetical protein
MNIRMEGSERWSGVGCGVRMGIGAVEFNKRVPCMHGVELGELIIEKDQN